jgi:Fur family ferric uptake transcriptional regulator
MIADEGRPGPPGQKGSETGMQDFVERLRRHGWRLTAQRRVIAEVLTGEHVHLTADEVHARAAARLPEISRATVYNTLNELREQGELREISLDGRAKRYDPNTSVPHHHMVCQSCGTIRDVQPRGDASLVLPAAQRRGFKVSAVDIVFRGWCTACAAKEARPVAAARARRARPRPPAS